MRSYNDQQDINESLKKYNKIEFSQIDKQEGLQKLMRNMEKMENKEKRPFSSVRKMFNPVLSAAMILVIVIGGYLLISQGVLDGGSSEDVTPPEGMEVYRNEEAGIITIKGDEWEFMEDIIDDYHSIYFFDGGDPQLGFSVHQSAIIMTHLPQEETDVLQESYEESSSYREFVEMFFDRNVAYMGMELDQVDTVNNILIFSHTGFTGDKREFLALIEVDNTPLFFRMWKPNDESLEEAMETDAYEQFKAMIQNTRPLD
ncbi:MULTISPECIES: hypothetical protein [Bacillaceae]|uniref:Uncharacterized protein n=1 Tax=Evansella alkalicola TaxID=745819 RepID=A0ABS6JQX7_9BACI|nr:MULTISPECIES: hypothetical protein [Bacillaceae]MBU9720947.1 hypothetical protein [Bacillus alkalicola]